jgi:predicted transcriptional regulator of viral defense system
MDKIVYTTPREQKVLSALAGTGMATAGMLHELFSGMDRHELNRLASSLASKGFLHRVRRGLYLVQPEPSKRPVIADPLALGQALFGGYIGFSSALRVWGLLEYEPFTVFCVTRDLSRQARIGEYLFRAVAMGRRAYGTTFSKGVYVSTPAKTVFDCFVKPQYAGGYSKVAAAVHECSGMKGPRFDWRELLAYFDDASPSLCARAGYVLDVIRREAGGIPAHVVSDLRGRVGNNTRLVPGGPSAGRYAREWKVLDNLGRENLMSWWEHG